MFVQMINEAVSNVSSDFADDPSIFFSYSSVNAINKLFTKIRDWTFEWKMSFNPDPSKQVQELIPSRKTYTIPHASFTFNSNYVQK